VTPSPLISVVVPSYNNADYIRETIDSILTQDFDDFELIVADHSSTDGTADILREYESTGRLTLVHTEAGGGAERNFNAVSRLATGKYLKLVPGDDVLKPGILTRQVALLEANPSATVVACPREFIDSRGSTVLARRGLQGLRAPMPGSEAIRRVIRAGSNLLGEPACVTIRRDVLELDNLWFFDFPFLVDQATYLRALVHGEFVPDLEVGAAFRMNSGQWSVALTGKQSEQVRAFHEWFHLTHPDIVTRADLVIGNARAAIMAQVRKLSYVILKNRMG